MIEPDAILLGTDWAALEHAYADAADLPRELVGLLSGDPEVAGNVLATLDAAVLHQGTIYSATAPAALYVAAVISDPRTLMPCGTALPWDDRTRPLRAALLEWLGNVADSAACGEDDGEEEPEEDLDAIAACRVIRRPLYQVVALYLDDPDESVRAAATRAAGHLLLAPDLAESRLAAAERLIELAGRQPAPERAGFALILAQWGVPPRDLLDDPEPAVRAYAALAPSLDAEPAALALVKEALLDPVTADAWFAGQQVLESGWLRFELVRALLRRTTVFAEIEEQAVAVARMTNAHTVDADWGPLLRRAFPAPHRPGAPLAPAQSAFLTALLDNPDCWPGTGNAIGWFRRAGLPYRRDELITVVRNP